jgi:NUMOD3 motif
MTEQNYYCYALYAPSDRLLEHPRYIGKGRGDRVFRTGRQRTKRVQAWIAELGADPLWDIVRSGMTQAEAFALEIELIAEHGREGIDEGGTLLNVSTGGAGASGYKHSADSLAKIVAIHTGRKRSDETREKMAAAKLGKPQSDAHKAAISAAKKGKPISQATIAGWRAYWTTRALAVAA